MPLPLDTSLTDPPSLDTLFLLDTSSEIPPSLESLPDHILFQIAEHTDVQTIWQMRTLCHAMLEAADRALKPYLATQRIVVDPPLVINGQTTLSSLSVEGDSDRAEQLDNISGRFQHHVEAYSVTARLLRNLTIELRDEHYRTGVKLLESLGPQLETLEIHLFENLWREADQEILNIFSQRHTPDPHIVRNWANFMSNWSIRSPQLGGLTDLSFHATTKTLHHFRELAPHVPNLRALTLGLHWLTHSPNWGSLEGSFDLGTVSFDLLERLTITGFVTWAADVVNSNLFDVASNLRNLTLHPSLFSSDPDDMASRDLTTKLAHVQQLVGLTMYGGHATDFVGGILNMYVDDWVASILFPNITSITFELRDCDTRNLDNLFSGGEDSWKLAPPSLERITCVDRRSQTLSTTQMSALGATTTTSFDDTSIRSLFDRYATLMEVRCVTDYPADPFAPFPSSVKQQPGTIACVYRSDLFA